MNKRILLLFALFLSACSTTSERVHGPKIAILAKFSKAIDVQEGIPLRVEMDSITPYCTQTKDKVNIEFRLRMTAFRPYKKAQDSFDGKASYFVAIIDESTSKVLSRTNHDLNFTFEEQQTTKVMFEDLEEVVPAGKDLAIYVGFNLRKDQVDLVQKQRQKKLQGF